MGKRSDFDRNPRDFYITPPEAIDPVLSHLPHPLTGRRFVEPCAGNGAISDYLLSKGYGLDRAFDIEPQADHIEKADAFKTYDMEGDFLITNPPWEKRPHEGEIFNKLLHHWLCSFDGDIWLLFDADWMHTKQAKMFKNRCELVISVGRVSWMQDGGQGKDNAAWYKFNHAYSGETIFKWRD